MLAKASYGPYARAMVRICKEENFHKRQGYEIMATLAAGTPGAEGDGAGRGQPLVVAVAHDVRPAATRTRRTARELLRWGVKRKSNDELRQRFVNLTVPQAKAIDLTLPDPDAAATTRRPENWEFGADRLGRVLAGGEGRRPVQPRAARGAATRRTTRAPGCARRRRRTPRSSGAARAPR